MGNKTTIEIRMDTRDRIKTFGNMGEYYDDVLNKLMDANEPAVMFRQEILPPVTMKIETDESVLDIS